MKTASSSSSRMRVIYHNHYRLIIPGFNIISCTLHAKHGRATYVRCDISDAVHVPSSPCCDVIRWADIALPTSTSHQLNTGTAQTYHQCLFNLQSWLETLTAVIQTGDIRRLIWTGSLCKSGHWTATICCCTTPSNMARSTLQGGNVTHQTCAGSQR